MTSFIDKLFGVLKSRRFWTSVGGVMIVLLHDVLGMDVETANGVVAMLIAWIVGDSINKTGTFIEVKDER